MAFNDKNRIKERNLYSIKKDPIAFVIRDTETGKYLLDNPEGLSFSDAYSNSGWWGNTIDDAAVFTDQQDAFYTLEDINSDCGEESNKYSADMDRFVVNPIYAQDIFVKDAPILNYRESKRMTFNRFKEDYAQDKKELDYLRNRNAVKQDRRSDLLAKQKERLGECFDRLCVTLDELFEPFGFYTKHGKYYGGINEKDMDLCFKKDGKEYIEYQFSIYRAFRGGLYDNKGSLYENFRDKVLKSVVARTMDALHNKDKYYPTVLEEFDSYEEGLAKLKQLVKDFEAKVKPIFDEAAEITNKELKVFVSDSDRNRQVYDARVKARKSYLKENPIAPGMVVIWNLQNGDVEDVEVISVNDADKTAKVRTDGGAVRNVPLSRLEVDTVRPGIDEKYW